MKTLFAILFAACGSFAFGSLHLRVDGEGYLRLMRDGHPVYAKEADLSVVSGLLGSHGATFLPAIHVSGSLATLKVDLMGNISLGGVSLGRFVIATATSAAQPEDGGFFTFSDRPTLTNPGEGTAGVVRFEGAPQPIKAPAMPKTETTTQVQAAPSKTTPHDSTPVKTANKTAAQPSASGKLEVLVHVHSEVGNEPITIEKIAQLKGPADLVEKAKAVLIATAPPIGVKRILDERTLFSVLRVASIPASQMLIVCPPGADVVRKSQTISVDDISKAARDAVVAKFGGTIPLVIAQKIQPIQAAEGDVTFEPSDPEAIGDGYYVTVTVKVGGEIAGLQSLTLVPSKDAPRAKQNDPVTVVMVLGTATVEVSGKLKSGGYVGQRIEVIIEGVGAHPTTHTGILVTPTRVEVQL